jgi:hypothetical protein
MRGDGWQKRQATRREETKKKEKRKSKTEEKGSLGFTETRRQNDRESTQLKDSRQKSRKTE